MMEAFQHLAVVSKVRLELENHLGISDNDLAEFLIDLAKQHKSPSSFSKALLNQDDSFPYSVAQNIYKIVLPETQRCETAVNVSKPGASLEESVLPGLAIPDKTDGSLKFGEGSEDRTERRLREIRDQYNHFEDAVPRQQKLKKLKEQKLEVGSIFNGTVKNVKDFGCFVQIDQTFKDIRGGFVEGLVHIRNISHERINNLHEVVNRGSKVKVKVLSVDGSKVALSLKDVDQHTGEDLSNMPSNSTSSSADFSITNRGKRRHAYTENELWEIRQLINSGVLPVEAYPTFDEETGVMAREHEVEEEVDIEKQDQEPNFLRGQTSSSMSLAQVKIIQNPEGSLQRAAMTQSTLFKEKRETKNAQEQQQLDSVPRNLGRAWNDPMANVNEKILAADVRGSGLAAREIPEWKRQSMGATPSYGKITSKSIQDQRESLPIYRLKSQLLEAFADNQVLVVIGETGSGKTTQMTQYLMEAGYADRGIIGCTQPRRVAALSVAKRVAEEFGCSVGQEVGYSIRFDDCTGPTTRIKYMTDGMLMREYLADNDINRYSVIMLDEAHERTVDTDVLFVLLKKLLLRRKDLKLIVTSATLDADKFSRYFFDCPIFTIPGRTYPVEILYAKEAESDYLDASLITVMQIHLSEPAGDILLFLTGQEEIDSACETLYERMKALGKKAPELIILPAYSSLPSEMQSRIFDPAPPGARKLVVATNIAEASITLDGVFYVVDPGFAKQNVYNPKLGMDSLVVVPISQASARQRAGRAGRTGPGKCYRLYTELAYKTEMMATSVPELQRTNLGSVVLKLKAMGINDLLRFEFMDAPPAQTLVAAMEGLYALGALDEEGLLTKMGRKMAEFPLDPVLAKTLLAAVELGCADEVVTIVAMLSVEGIFFRPREKQQQADQKKARFNQVEGDHLTLLAVYAAWEKSRFSTPWCHENFIQSRSIKRAQDIRKQLLGIMDRYRMPVESCGRQFQCVQIAIASGFFTNVAKRDPQEGYRTVLEGQPVFVHPSSALFNKNPEWVIYHELVLTTKEYMRNCMAVNPKWLLEVAPQFFKKADPNKLSKRKRNEKIEPLYDHRDPEHNWRLSKRRG